MPACLPACLPVYACLSVCHATVAQKIYMTKMKELLKKRKFKIFVHPVPPAMDITRSIVTAWNTQMEARLTGAHAVAGIEWLDFWPQLLTEEGESAKMKPEYVLDGIHLHPCYLPLVESALTKAMAT